MQSLSHHEIIILLLQLSIMLIFGKFLGEVVKRFKQPSVVGEILAGILLGPTILGTISPDTLDLIFPKTGNSPIALSGFSTFSVILLLFIAGLEVQIPLILGQRRKAIYTSSLGILIPFVLGFSAPFLFESIFEVTESEGFVFSLFLGTALSISALPVIARTLMDLGIFRTNLGMLVIASAMVDDFLGWMIFSVILGLINQGSSTTSVLITLFSTLGFAAVMLTIGRRAMDRTLPWIGSHVSFPGGILAFAIIMGLLGAAFTESIGIHAVFGSFLVGVAMGDSIHMSKKTKEIIHDFVTNIFAPLFFVSIGLKVNFIAYFDWSLVLLIMVLSFVGKIVGCGLGAYLGGYKKREALAVGFGMNARGAMEIILATLALNAGVINQYMFVALVVMALFTSMTSGYMMKLLLTKTMQEDNEPTGIILMGDNEVSQYIAKVLTENKIPVLLTDPDFVKFKMTNGRGDLMTYQGHILDKGIIDRLDLTRYGQFMALCENPEANEKACKLFGTELGENKVFRLISKQEFYSASLALPENLLFRGMHWDYNSLKKVVAQDPEINTETNFKSEDALNKFINFQNKRKNALPLFVQKARKRMEPVSSYKQVISNQDVLIYIDLREDPPRPVKSTGDQSKGTEEKVENVNS